MEAKNGIFHGTYFSRETVLRLARGAQIFAWVVLGIYAVQLLAQAGANVLSIVRGYWVGMAVTDMAMSFVYLLESPLRGVVYFVVLQAVAQALLMLMDMEENSRRAARALEE